jgi:hypothetical protein
LLRFIEVNYKFIQRLAAMQHILRNRPECQGSLSEKTAVVANNDTNSHPLNGRNTINILEGVSRDQFAITTFSSFVKTIHTYNETLPRTQSKCTALQNTSVIKELVLHVFETLTTPLIQKWPHVELTLDSSNASAKVLDARP